MTKEFLEFFNGWSKRNSFYLVTGSDLPKMQEQVQDVILERADGLFTCCGNQFWREGNTKQWPTDWKMVYENKFKVPETLRTYLGEQLRFSDYPVRAGNHIEDRGSLLNFSVVGRNCNQQERNDYNEYDKLVSERKGIAKYIKENWSDLDAVIGGQISIDIYPKGNDKSQILDIIEQERLVQPDEVIFIGDGIENKGNDYPLAKLMEETEKQFGKGEYKWYQTDGWKQTKEILENLSD